MLYFLFDKILSDIEVVSEYVEIESYPDRIEFVGKSDTGEAVVTMEPNSEGLEEINVKEESKATYSLDYLLKIVKSVSLLVCQLRSNILQRCQYVLNLGSPTSVEFIFI